MLFLRNINVIRNRIRCIWQQKPQKCYLSVARLPCCCLIKTWNFSAVFSRSFRVAVFSNWKFAGASCSRQHCSPFSLVVVRPFRHASDVDSIRKSKSPPWIHPFADPFHSSTNPNCQRNKIFLAPNQYF